MFENFNIDQATSTRVCSFNHIVLLTSVGSREIVVDAIVGEEFLNGGTGEIRAIVTSDSWNREFHKNFNSFNEINEFKGFFGF